MTPMHPAAYAIRPGGVSREACADLRLFALEKLLANTVLVTVCPELGACWEWTGYRLHFGHGALRINYTRWRTHRLAWDEFIGPIPDGLGVLHRCDNPPCWNLDHLFLGTRDENRSDCLAKGRQAKGENVHCHRFIEAEVLAIRYSTEPTKTLATRYGVARTSIQRIRARKTWKHLV